MGAPQGACHTVECPLPGGAVPRLWMPGYRASSSVGICGRGSDLATTSPWGGLDAAGVPDLRTQLGPCWLCVPILSRARTSRSFLVCRKCEIVSVGQATQRGAASPHSGGYTDPRRPAPGPGPALSPPTLPPSGRTDLLSQPALCPDTFCSKCQHIHTSRQAKYTRVCTGLAPSAPAAGKTNATRWPPALRVAPAVPPHVWTAPPPLVGVLSAFCSRL